MHFVPVVVLLFPLSALRPIEHLEGTELFQTTLYIIEIKEEVGLRVKKKTFGLSGDGQTLLVKS